jgi:hypothetical protein
MEDLAIETLMAPQLQMPLTVSDSSPMVGDFWD